MLVSTYNKMCSSHRIIHDITHYVLLLIDDFFLINIHVDSVVQLVSLIKDRTTILIHLITYSELIGQQVSRTIRNGNLNYLIVYNTS